MLLFQGSSCAGTSPPPGCTNSPKEAHSAGPRGPCPDLSRRPAPFPRASWRPLVQPAQPHHSDPSKRTREKLPESETCPPAPKGWGPWARKLALPGLEGAKRILLIVLLIILLIELKRRQSHSGRSKRSSLREAKKAALAHAERRAVNQSGTFQGPTTQSILPLPASVRLPAPTGGMVWLAQVRGSAPINQGNLAPLARSSHRYREDWAWQLVSNEIAQGSLEDLCL